MPLAGRSRSAVRARPWPARSPPYCRERSATPQRGFARTPCPTTDHVQSHPPRHTPFDPNGSPCATRDTTATQSLPSSLARLTRQGPSPISTTDGVTRAGQPKVTASPTCATGRRFCHVFNRRAPRARPLPRALQSPRRHRLRSRNRPARVPRQRPRRGPSGSSVTRPKRW